MALRPPAAPPAADVLVARIAAELAASAIVVDDQATWLAPQLADRSDATTAGEGAAVSTMGRTGATCLYDGSAGIGWALAVVGVQRGDEQLRRLAVAAVRHALANTSAEGPAGLYDGAAGVGLAAIAVGGLVASTPLRAAGVELLRAAGASTPASDDLVDGSAGIALACLRGAELTGQTDLLSAARHHADALLTRADRHPWGWSWAAPDGPGLCGLAHGAAGGAWALGEVAAALQRAGDPVPVPRAGGEPPTGEPAADHRPTAGPDHATAARLRAASDAARRYERSWFDPGTNTWPDLRADVAAPGGTAPRPSLWCHGGVGIALSRLALHRSDPRPALAGEAVAARVAACRDAVEQVRGGVLPSGLTVCHGLGGTLALLVTTAEQLGVPEDLDTARSLLAEALLHLGGDPARWPGGLLGEPGPGLMTGLAGTMLVLAALDDPRAAWPLTRLGG